MSSTWPPAGKSGATYSSYAVTRNGSGSKDECDPSSYLAFQICLSLFTEISFSQEFLAKSARLNPPCSAANPQSSCDPEIYWALMPVSDSKSEKKFYLE